MSDSNHGSLVLEATALPIAPQPHSGLFSLCVELVSILNTITKLTVGLLQQVGGDHNLNIVHIKMFYSIGPCFGIEKVRLYLLLFRFLF